MNEYYSGFDNIGHNAMMQLLYLWIIPKSVPPRPRLIHVCQLSFTCSGAWLVGSAYMIYSLGGDIIQGLETASAHVKDE